MGLCAGRRHHSEPTSGSGGAPWPRSILYPYVYRDDIYWSELERRYPLITGMPLDPEGDIFQVDARYAFPLAPPPEEGD